MTINLRAERLNRGLSLRDGAVQMDISAPTLARAEEPGMPMPQPRIALKIATFYGYKVTDIWPVDTAAAAA